jgi:hypothetical protein
VTDAEDFDRGVRAAIARAIRERGAIPKVADVALALGCDRSDVEAAFLRMIEGRVFIPRHRSLEILAYNPFCSEATNFAVTVSDRIWSAICAWDALGVPPALGAQGSIDARCADCAEPIRIEVGVDGRATAPERTVMQVATPARDFWKNIYRT